MCSICLEEVKSNVVELVCDHKFCEGCLLTWISIPDDGCGINRRRCPTCRTPICAYIIISEDGRRTQVNLAPVVDQTPEWREDPNQPQDPQPRIPRQPHPPRQPPRNRQPPPEPQEYVNRGLFEDVLFDLGELEGQLDGGLQDLHLDDFLDYEDYGEEDTE